MPSFRPNVGESGGAPHGPYRVPEKYSKPYEGKVKGDADLARFYGMIANIDENVGKLLDLLDNLDLADNTIVIFMTDNGTARGAVFSDNRGNLGIMLRGFNYWMRGRKGSPYEGGGIAFRVSFAGRPVDFLRHPKKAAMWIS